MSYEYSGYLKTILGAPEPDVRDSLDSVVFTADDLARWGFSDFASDLEWQRIPATCRRTEEGARLEGRFTDVRQIDNLAADDPSFWVPLSSLSVHDPRFPIDTERYPVVELTYRCATSNARPAWVWTYPGGFHFDGLAPTAEWRTIARLVRHQGFPAQLDAVILRLYAISRTVEAVEFGSIRFRALSPAEARACAADAEALANAPPLPRYPILDEFLPFGCYMDAGSSKRLASMLGVSLQDYWGLVLEDVARHGHNTIALERVDRFTTEEWRDLQGQAAGYGIRFVAIYNLALTTPAPYYEEFIETHIRPYADSPAILAWSLHDEPPEHAFRNLMQVRPYVERADPNHPLAVVLRDPNAYGLMGRHFAASGITHYRSHTPWEIGDIVQTHLPLNGGQQFWVTAPAFVYATDTPEWPSCPEMRLMMNLAVANGARGWFTYAYHNDPIWIRGSCQRSLTGPFLTFSDLWAEMSYRVEYYNALAPLLLACRPEPGIEPWFRAHGTGRAEALLPRGVPPTHIHRLSNDTFELYCIGSNDVREMTTVHIDIDAEAFRGLEAYDLSDYVTTRRWAPMELARHMEMFPGQMHMILVGAPKVCAHWHDVIAARLLECDRRQLAFDLTLGHAYGLKTPEMENALEAGRHRPGAEAFAAIRRARDTLLNAIYDTPAISETRSKLVQISAQLCACDGNLCRLLGHGEADKARQLGYKVIPLARELTHLRLELRQGLGAKILAQSESLVTRALELLAEIRAQS